MIDLEEELRAAMRETEIYVPPDLAHRALAARARRRRNRDASAAVVVIVLVVGGLVTVLARTGHPASSGSGDGQVVSSGPASRVPVSSGPSYRVPAQREAARLKTLAVLPTGSRVTTTHPAAIDDLAMVPVAGDDLVQTQPTYYTVSLGGAAMQRFLEQHVPTGLMLGVVGSPGAMNAAGADSYSVEDGEPSSATFSDATLAFNIAPVSAQRSVVRVAAYAIAVNPEPLPVPSFGTPARLTVAGGCPSSDRGDQISNPDTTGLTSAIVPPGVPTSALLCFFDGLNGSPFRLVATRRLTASQAGALARAARASALGHSAGVTSCPMDDGRATWFALAYPGRPDVDVEAHTSGCGGVDNGVISGRGSSMLATFVG